jgi:hypothetical protein
LGGAGGKSGFDLTRGGFMKRFLFGLALVLLPFPAFGFGETFKIETTGTEYCGDFDVTKFNANNNVDLWVKVGERQRAYGFAHSKLRTRYDFPNVWPNLPYSGDLGRLRGWRSLCG